VYDTGVLADAPLAALPLARKKLSTALHCAEALLPSNTASPAGVITC
jgi:hypothetical protein